MKLSDLEKLATYAKRDLHAYLTDCPVYLEEQMQHQTQGKVELRQTLGLQPVHQDRRKVDQEREFQNFPFRRPDSDYMRDYYLMVVAYFR